MIIELLMKLDVILKNVGCTVTKMLDQNNAPKGTVTVKTPYDGSIVAKNVTYAPYYWPGALSPVSGDSSYFGITDRYKEYEAVYYGGDYTKGSVMLIK